MYTRIAIVLTIMTMMMMMMMIRLIFTLWMKEFWDIIQEKKGDRIVLYILCYYIIDNDKMQYSVL